MTSICSSDDVQPDPYKVESVTREMGSKNGSGLIIGIIMIMGTITSSISTRVPRGERYFSWFTVVPV